MFVPHQCEEQKLGVTKSFKEDRMKIGIILFVTHGVALICSPQTFKAGPPDENNRKRPDIQKSSNVKNGRILSSPAVATPRNNKNISWIAQ